MARFDEVYAELQAKMDAAIRVIAQHPEVAAQVREAIDGAQTAAEIAEAQAQDDARANALSNVITGVRAVLQEVAPRPDDAAPEPPPAVGGTGQNGGTGGTGDGGGSTGA